MEFIDIENNLENEINTKVNIVNHTHWDREWYFTTMDALVLSDQVFTDVLEELGNNKNAKFCLDGQISIIEDYLSIRPEKLELIKKFVNEDRLFIGPWYTQTDAQLVSGESIIRNLSIGIYGTNKIGKHMKVGYLPDTFGFNAQMPTILKSCDIDNIIFWRGINYDTQVKSSYFLWKGLSGKTIYAANFPYGYGKVPRLLLDEEFREKKLFPLVNKIRSLSNLSEIILPIGNDQVEITHNLNGKIEEINNHTKDVYRQSSYEEFIEVLRKNKEKLEIYEGEFRQPKTGRVHKTIGSIRYDIKKTNFEVEQLLLNRVEPLYAIAKSLGIDISRNLIVKAWKKILEGQAHDSMGGCITDDVANDVLYRMKQASQICGGLENLVKRRIAEGVGIKEDEVIVFNTLPYEYSGYKIVEFMSKSKEVTMGGVEELTLLSMEVFEGKKNILIEGQGEDYYINEEPYYKITVMVKLKLPSMGYKVFNIVKSSMKVVKTSQQLEINNSEYKIFVEESLLCIQLKNGTVIKDFIKFENCGNDGDTYDFSPLREDEPICFRVTKGNSLLGGSIEKLILSGKKVLPKTLEDRLTKVKLGELNIKLEITLIKDSSLIECKIIVDNKIESHRLRVAIRSNIFVKESIASIPFGYINRPILNGKIEEWNSRYLENPIDLEIFDSTVSIANDKNILSIYSKGIKEYQVIEDAIYLTLFSTTGQLGKPNLLYRPGRASGDTTKQGHIMIPTPLAQMQGLSQFEFAISLIREKFNEHVVEKRYETYTSQNISYQMQTFNRFLHRIDNKIQPNLKTMFKYQKEYSLLSIGQEVVFSSLSPSLKDDALLLRLKNSSNKKISISEYNFKNFTKWELVNNIEVAKENNNLAIEPYDMIVFKLYN